MSDVHITPAGLRVVRVLVGNRPQTISELMKATEVTRTAVIGQLDHLIAGGFVARSVERHEGRGRPRHLYSATPASLRLFFLAKQECVLPAVWKAIEGAGGPQLMRKVLKRVARCMADSYSAKITAKEPKARLRQFIQLMREEGGIVESDDHDGELTLRKRSCPFVTMVDENRTVCKLDLDILGLVVGCPVRCVSSRHQGAPCCEFEIDAGK
jgi:DeoR family transcriptional regulator, suf operon transcriptional repressor